MANFNTDVNITPDRGLKATQKPRIFSANYGDGYQQRVAAGINNIPEEWNLTWKNRTSIETNKIIKFLEDLNGTSSFDWYPPGYEIGSTTTSAATKKLIDTSQYFTKRYLNATVAGDPDHDPILDEDLALMAVNYELLSIIVDLAPVDQVLYDLLTSTVDGYQRGDINNDNVINTNDSQALLRFIVDLADNDWIRNNILGAMLADMPTYSSYFSPDFVTNTATITAIDSATQLSLSSDILASGETYTIYPYTKFICPNWSITEPVQGIRTITAKFTRVFEP